MDNKEVEDIFNIEPQNDESSVPVYEPPVQEEVPTYEDVQPVEPVQEEVPTYEEVQPVEPVQEEVPTYEEVQPVEPVQEEAPTYEEVQPVEPVQEEVPTYEEVQPVQTEQAVELESDESVKNTTTSTINENPNAKITFSNNTDNENDNFKLTNEDINEIKKSLKDNGSLKFVAIIGILILIVIMLLPLINNI